MFVCRSDEIPLKIYDQSLPISLSSSWDLYNAMIYPFTRMVIYGVIWYQGKRQ
jgi:hypothetical protein